MAIVKGAGRWVSLAIISSILLAASSEARAAEGTSLEVYLGKLGYLGVPFKVMRDKFQVIDGIIAGKHRVLALDTGCNPSVLGANAARGVKTLGELGISLDDGRFGVLTNSAIVLIDKLTLGPAQFVNQPARVENIRMDFAGSPFEGLLGYDFLCRNSCLMDLGKKQLYVRSKPLSKEQSDALEKTLAQSRFIPVPTVSSEETALDGLLVKAKLNGEETELLADTGASYTGLDARVANRLKLPIYRQSEIGSLVPGELRFRAVGVGDVGAHRGKLVTVSSFELGPRKFKNIHCAVFDFEPWKKSAKGDPAINRIQGTLGQEILSGEGALIDVSRGKIWLRP